jgi:hypothetical protein
MNWEEYMHFADFLRSDLFRLFSRTNCTLYLPDYMQILSKEIIRTTSKFPFFLIIHTNRRMYYSFLLISNKFWMGGGDCAVMLLNHTSAVMLLNRTGGVVWAL